MAAVPHPVGLRRPRAANAARRPGDRARRRGGQATRHRLYGCARQAAAATYDVGLRLTDERTGGTLAYVPAAGAVDDAVRSIAAGAGLLLFDGTFWSDDELAEAGGSDAPSAVPRGACSSCRGQVRNGLCSCTSTTPTPCSVALPPSGPRSRRPASKWGTTAWSSSCDRGAVAAGAGGRAVVAGRFRASPPRRARAALSPPPSLQPADACGRTVARRARAVGGAP